MQPEPRPLVTAATDHLAQRLGEVIPVKLSGVVDGRPWIDVLKVLDQAKGREFSRYFSGDLQLQLRMFTERLGGLGYPFDDFDRTVSTLGSELRTVRRRLAHTAPFDWLDAFRATDYCVRLLQALGDEAGLKCAEGFRSEAFAQLVDDGRAPSSDDRDAAGSMVVAEPQVGQAEGERERATAEDPVSTFEQWPGARVGARSDLTSLKRREARERVRALAEEIVDVEWPVKSRRLARLIAAGFGVQRPGSLLPKIERQIGLSDVQVDEDDFVWPGDVEPETWRGFREYPANGRVDLWQVSPREIANVMRSARASTPGIDEDGMEEAFMEHYGRVRRTAAVRKKLDKAWEYLG